MKKLIVLVILTLFYITGQAQIHRFKAIEFSHKISYNGIWLDWSQWEEVNLLMVMDLSKNLITIYSEEVQRYKLLETRESIQDGTGEQISFSFIDNEFDAGTLRLRKQDNGTRQIYINFDNIIWVYNIIKIN